MTTKSSLMGGRRKIINPRAIITAVTIIPPNQIDLNIIKPTHKDKGRHRRRPLNRFT